MRHRELTGMSALRVLRIFATLGIVCHAAFGHASENRKDALVVSYKTPETSKGLGGRFELVKKLEARGFRMTIVSDRFPERPDAIEPKPENLVAALDRLAADPEVRELAIVLDLHGVPRKKHERSHSVLFGDAELSLDRFRPALRKLRKRGARVVMLDLSCYSGASLPLARDGACVATDGAKASENFPQFLDGFSAKLAPEMSFEDAFLAARSAHLMPRTPRISSDAGLAVMAGEEVIERAFAKLDRSQVLGYEGRILGLDWNESELRDAQRSFALWRGMGEIIRGAAFLVLPDYAQSAIRFAPLVSAERSYYERNLRAIRAETASNDAYEPAASRACVDFKF